jgi:HJR/Mrr/RecB family endonuclease
MARRRRDDDWIWPVAQLVGLFVALGFIYPPFRQVVVGIGSLFVVLLVVAVVVVLGLGTYKLLARRGTAQTFSFNASAPSATLAASDASQVERPGTTEQLINQLRSIDWFQFEQLVALVYRKQGYAVSRRGGANPDGGIDLVIEKNGTRTAVQCKHWKTWNVGVKAVREFLGALTDAGIQRGLFITLGGYTGDAKRLADKHGIEVVNETGLAGMLEATDARFDPAVLEILNDTRKLCPKCERELVLKTAGRGRGAGKQFWGCSGYTFGCRFTLPLSNGQPKAELAAVR